MWSLFLYLGEYGSKWRSFADLPEHKRDVFQAMFHVDAKKIGSQRMGHARSTWRHWLRFSREQGFDVRAPDITDVAGFLDQYESRGPTAALARFRGLTLLEKTVGA